MDLIDSIGIGILMLWCIVWGFIFYIKEKQIDVNFTQKGYFRRNSKGIVILTLMTSVPFVWVSLFGKSAYFDYQQVVEKDSFEFNRTKESKIFFLNALDKFPKKPEIYLDYVDHFSGLNDIKSLEKLEIVLKDLDDTIFANNIKIIAYGYTGLDCFRYNAYIKDSSDALSNFALAEFYKSKNNQRLSELKYKSVLTDKEIGRYAFQRLKQFWLENKSYQYVREQIYDSRVFPYFSFSERSKVFIQDRSWGWYIYNTFYRDFLSSDLFGYTGALFAIIIWFIFIFRLLFIRSERLFQLLLLFVLGSILPVLVYVIGDLLDYFGLYHVDSLVNVIINIGMVEELVKFIPWLLIYLCFKNKLNRPVHFVLLPIVSALGFAFTENLVYINKNNYDIIFMRSTICVIIHSCCSVFIGYGLFKGINSNVKRNILTYPLLGFVIASFAHGLYDWMIFNNRGVLTLILSLIILHFFIICVNNLLNLSNIINKRSSTILRKSGFMLMLGMILIFLSQYWIVGIKKDTEYANQMLSSNIVYVILTAIYLLFAFRKLKITPNHQYQFKAHDILGKFLVSGPLMENYDNYNGKGFKFYAPKTNRYLGGQLPISGMVLRQVMVQGDDSWYEVRLDKNIQVGNCHPTTVLIKPKYMSQELFMDKIEILFMLIPNIDKYFRTENHHSSDFFYTGRVYSRPI